MKFNIQNIVGLGTQSHRLTSASLLEFFYLYLNSHHLYNIFSENSDSVTDNINIKLSINLIQYIKNDDKFNNFNLFHFYKFNKL